MTIHRLAIGLGAAAMLATAGCRVHVNKDSGGDDKSVQVDTPFGGVHVNTNQTGAADMGLPVYPGAVVAKDEGDDKSADVHMGFGEWQLRVRAVSYESADPEDKITAFYKNALGRYGTVITCRNNTPVGMPTQTTEGLTCSDHGKDMQVQVNGDTNIDHSSDGLELKAGSPRHQHIVGFETPKDGQTRFSLVALDLPAGTDGSGKSD